MPQRTFTRRAWLTASAGGLAALAAPLHAASPALRVEDIEAGSGKTRRKARLLVPSDGDATRLLVLLHGKGETVSERLGLEAWSRLYGLVNAYERLTSPPIRPLLERPKIAEARLTRINAELAKRPFRGLVVVCPTTPYPGAVSDRKRLFDSYTEWLTKELIPTAKEKVPTLGSAVGLDGCSMGGYVGLEVFSRAPSAFRTFGTVQSAIGTHRVAGYVEHLRQVRQLEHQPAIHLQTSTHDPFREATELLSRRLTQAGVENTLEVIAGAHDQHWLRQIGSLEMLRWHDRQL